MALNIINPPIPRKKAELIMHWCEDPNYTITIGNAKFLLRKSMLEKSSFFRTAIENGRKTPGSTAFFKLHLRAVLFFDQFVVKFAIDFIYKNSDKIPDQPPVVYVCTLMLNVEKKFDLPGLSQLAKKRFEEKLDACLNGDAEVTEGDAKNLVAAVQMIYGGGVWNGVTLRGLKESVERKLVPRGNMYALFGMTHPLRALLEVPGLEDVVMDLYAQMMVEEAETDVEEVDEPEMKNSMGDMGEGHSVASEHDTA